MSAGAKPEFRKTARYDDDRDLSEPSDVCIYNGVSRTLTGCTCNLPAVLSEIRKLQETATCRTSVEKVRFHSQTAKNKNVPHRVWDTQRSSKTASSRSDHLFPNMRSTRRNGPDNPRLTLSGRTVERLVGEKRIAIES